MRDKRGTIDGVISTRQWRSMKKRLSELSTPKAKKVEQKHTKLLKEFKKDRSAKDRLDYLKHIGKD